MKIADGLTARLIGGSLVLALLVPGSALALPGPQDAGPGQQRQEAPAEGASTPAPSSPQTGTESLPDSPGAGQSPAAEKFGGQSEAPESLPQPQQDGNQKPV